LHVVVIGCGLAGVTTAYFLRRSGAEVTVVDRAAGPARETSFANGSLLTPSLADPWNAPGIFTRLFKSFGSADAPMLMHAKQIPGMWRWGLRFLANSRHQKFEESYLHNTRFAIFSQQTMAEMRAETALDFGYTDSGILKIFEEQSALDEAVKVAHWLKQVNIRHARLDVDQLMETEPALQPIRDRLVGAVHYLDDEVGDARLYCEALHSLLSENQVNFRFSEQVLDFELKPHGIRAVRTPSGRLAADAFVLAAGSFSRGLAGKLKLGIPLVPAKGYSITVPVSENVPRLPVVDDTLHAVVVPLGGKSLRVAGTAEFAGFDTTIRQERINNLIGLLGRVYPQVDIGGKGLEAWSGLRPMSPDGRPILGGCKLDNLFLNTGHGALGWTLACASGRVVAEQTMGEALSYDITPFQLSRF